MSAQLPYAPPPRGPNRPPREGRQFSLRFLFVLMLAAACVMGAPLAMSAIGATIVGLALLAIPMVTFEITCNTERCPAGGWVHLAGMAIVALSLPLLCLPLLAAPICLGGGLLMASGATMAFDECQRENLPEESFHVAWAAMANTALFFVLALLGAGWALS